MPIAVQIPTPLRSQTEGQDAVSVTGANVQEVLGQVVTQFPGLKDRIFDEAGQLRRFINLYLNDEDIRFLDGLDTSVKDNDALAIIPAVAGG